MKSALPNYFKSKDLKVLRLPKGYKRVFVFQHEQQFQRLTFAANGISVEFWGTGKTPEGDSIMLDLIGCAVMQVRSELGI